MELGAILAERQRKLYVESPESANLNGPERRSGLAMSKRLTRMDEAAPDSRCGERTCPQCGVRFVCGAEAGAKACWCAAFPAVDIDPALPGCLCPVCLEKRTAAAAAIHG